MIKVKGYRCSYCGKFYFKEYFCKKHEEKRCRLNPSINIGCKSCEHLFLVDIPSKYNNVTVYDKYWKCALKQRLFHLCAKHKWQKPMGRNIGLEEFNLILGEHGYDTI